MTKTNIATDNLSRAMVDAINSAFNKEAERIFDEHKASLIRELESTKAEIVSKAVLRMRDFVRFDTMERDLVITVVKESLKDESLSSRQS